MPDEKATRSRTYTVSMSEGLSKEIRAVAASMGISAVIVRTIVAGPALDALSQTEHKVRNLVARHFQAIAEEMEAASE